MKIEGENMRFKRFVAAIIAAFTAITPLSLNTPEFMPATSFAEETGDAAKYPDWVPTDFESAVEFCNTYGATHIEDGYVCIVYKMDYEHYDPEIMIHDLRYQFRKEGDALRTESIEGYTYSSEPVSGDTEYCVMLFSAKSSGSYEFDMIDDALTTSPDTEHKKASAITVFMWIQTAISLKQIFTAGCRTV